MAAKRGVPSKLRLLVLISIACVTPMVAQTPTDRPAWGDADRILVSIAGREFSPASSTTTYESIDVGRFSTTPGAHFVANPQIPSGALLTYLELDYCDDVAGDVTLIFGDCSFLGIDCQLIQTLDSGNGDPSCSYVSVDLTPHAYTMNNNSRRLVLTAVMESGTDDNILMGAYVGYKLQVSPAPGSPTFTDVPLGHPFFQFVEALAASGITAGCGGGNFCPEQPLTRGQMAVFLSIALGLHFPN